MLSVSSHETDNACKDSNISELQHIRAEPFVCSGRDGAMADDARNGIDRNGLGLGDAHPGVAADVGCDGESADSTSCR